MVSEEPPARMGNNRHASLANLLQWCHVLHLTSSVPLDILGEVLFKGKKIPVTEPMRRLSELRQVPEGN